MHGGAPRHENRGDRVKYWETIANHLMKAGWSLGWVSAIDCEGRTIWIVDAHRDDGRRFLARADEKLTAFVELELAIKCSGLLGGLQEPRRVFRPCA